jgi:hypothetical protein
MHVTLVPVIILVQSAHQDQFLTQINPLAKLVIITSLVVQVAQITRSALLAKQD